MPNEIWKFRIPLSQIEDVISFEIPRGARILSAINQKEALCIYAYVDEGMEEITRQFLVIETGKPFVSRLKLPINARFVGTVLFLQGTYVLHVWDLGEG